MHSVHELIEWIALAIEVFGVLVIVGSIVLAFVPSSILSTRDAEDALTGYKQRMGRGLLLGLELLLAADIVETVGTPLTTQMLIPVGLLVLIRSFLSWSLEVEIDGHWPWDARSKRSQNVQQQPRGATALSRER
jgi:uncharacterized membrane protein